jgi:hypothetical protein
MPLELVYICHRECQGKRGVVVMNSVSHYYQPESSEETARVFVTNISRNSDVPLFVVIFGSDDLPREAHAVKRGIWRNLELIKAPPLPDDLSTLNLYSGNPNAKSPYLVTRW